MLEALLGESSANGWAVGVGSIAQIQREAVRLEWTEVPIRRGGPTITTLRPVDRAEAEPNSLSARYGKEAQPLHTDGAHLPDPPDVVVLACETTSTTPTRLWNHKRWPSYLLHGIFLVSSGSDSFFAPAYTYSRLRYDPGCMLPCDARARQAVAFFDEAASSEVEHAWNKPGQLLLIDNRRVMHARASAVDEPQREIQRVSFHLKRKTP